MTINKSPDIRREEIFAAALRCFNQHGYYKTSIDEIASSAAISKGGIYHHFKSKKDLFIQLFRTRVNSYFNSLTETLRSHEDAARRLQFLVERSGEVFQENMAILQFCLEFVAMSSRDADFRDEVTAMYKNRVATFAALIDDGIALGTFKQMDSEGIARALHFLSMGFFLTYFTVNLDFNPEVQHRINMNTILEGIKRQA